MSATEQLRAMFGLPRYTGMDAYAQELADSGKLATGDYKMAVSAVADTPADAYYLMRGHDYSSYTAMGIGLHNNYWVVVFS